LNIIYISFVFEHLKDSLEFVFFFKIILTCWNSLSIKHNIKYINNILIQALIVCPFWHLCIKKFCFRIWSKKKIIFSIHKFNIGKWVTLYSCTDNVEWVTVMDALNLNSIINYCIEKWFRTKLVYQSINNKLLSIIFYDIIVIKVFSFNISSTVVNRLNKIFPKILHLKMSLSV